MRRFLVTLQRQEGLLTGLDEDLWVAVTDKAVVYYKTEFIFVFWDETE